ncbi:DUF2127 domain-containing protein [Yinghuangia seranimata]|uniref:DUF2127 domain-containing protein n=1 Tax=Yinghuangia seranimata TaxID=408067 RepID=UPI00248B7A11|nr:DUF2127 domain-containing protein [Yinghuangia seranimata]MDI2128239.1 DUF2127 domain-containing protein [Yinghuangia seranimata]
MDWNRRACARRGHETYAPDEPGLRAKLHTETPIGVAWRCLRCGDFVLGDAKGSGPAQEAPEVLRGRALRDVLILRFLAIERAARGVLILFVAYAIWRFSNAQDSVRRVFEEDLTLLKPLFNHYGYDIDNSPIVESIRKTFDYKHSTLVWVAVGLVVYAVIEIVEAVGLWMLKRWAEYLTVVATGMFLPLEVYELTEKVSYFKIGTLVLNIIAVLYIIVAKRLFGLRGGHEAFEAARREESLLEIEDATHAGPVRQPWQEHLSKQAGPPAAETV